MAVANLSNHWINVANLSNHWINSSRFCCNFISDIAANHNYNWNRVSDLVLVKIYKDKKEIKLRRLAFSLSGTCARSSRLLFIRHAVII